MDFDDYKNEFEVIADQALDGAVTGLMHRDCQSKNIMLKDNQVYFIDFQSARTGPLQYDLASLLIDPYVRLGQTLQAELQLVFAHLDDRFQGVDQFYPADFLQMIRTFGLLDVGRNADGSPLTIPQHLLEAEALAHGEDRS